MGKEHHHHHHELSGKSLWWTIVLNLSITIAELIGGLISGSMALLSDATHNFSDVLSLIISYIANRLTRKKPTPLQTYGFKRSEIMAAFINSTTLIVLAVFILIGGIQRFFKPEIINAQWVIWMALGSIVVNGLSVLFIHKDAKDNMNIRSSLLHLFSDLMTSVAVLLGGLAIKYFQWYWLDALFSVLIALYLLYNSFDILKASFKIIMQFTPQNIDIFPTFMYKQNKSMLQWKVFFYNTFYSTLYSNMPSSVVSNPIGYSLLLKLRARYSYWFTKKVALSVGDEVLYGLIGDNNHFAKTGPGFTEPGLDVNKLMAGFAIKLSKDLTVMPYYLYETAYAKNKISSEKDLTLKSHYLFLLVRYNFKLMK